MSVICQNFVQNAWKKDLCSNCFKSIGDHENIETVENVETPNDNGYRNGKFVSRASVRSAETPHTTWKSLINEKNGKNSQPFKLENGFQGRLLTINKALNGADKHHTETNAKIKISSQMVHNVASSKTNNSTLKKPALNSEKNVDKQNGSIVKNENNVNIEKNSEEKLKDAEGNGRETIFTKQKYINGHLTESNNSIKDVDKKHAQAKSTKNNEKAPPNLHGILKKGSPTLLQSNVHSRRSSNVGFKDEEPLVIGYGGRDFSPEELDWDMASDGEAEGASDSLDETEDDRVFSKMTKKNTEFNSDNTNLLKMEANETKATKEVKHDGKSHTVTKEIKNNYRQDTVKMESPRPEIKDKNKTHVHVKKNCKQNNDLVNGKDCDNSNSQTLSISPNKSGKTVYSDIKNATDSINVAVRNDKTNHAVKTSELEEAKTEGAISGVEVKNSSDFINGAAPPSSNVDASDTKSGNTTNAVMFSDGGETTWQENTLGESDQLPDNEAVCGQILQAINTSLTNRHKKRENSDLSVEEQEVMDSCKEENEINRISTNNEVSDVQNEKEGSNEITVNEKPEAILNIEPRESFLHDSFKPSAIYGPASDLFVSRSNSSSSSSSDEQLKGHVSLSINVIVNGDDSNKYNGDDKNDLKDVSTQEENESNKNTHTENKVKPEIPAKPTKSTLKQENKVKIFKVSNEISNIDSTRKCEGVTEDLAYYSTIPDGMKTSINLVDPYAESNIYHEVIEKDIKPPEAEADTKAPGRESKLAALAIELEQARHTNCSTKRQAPAPPKVPDPPLEDPPSCTGRVSPTVDATHTFSSFRGESMGFSSASSTTSTSSQDTEAGYASWNLHGDLDEPPKHKSKSFLLAQYSKCKMLALGYAEDSARARKKFSIKKLLKLGKESETPPIFDPNSPNPKAWKYSDQFERPRAKLEIIHPMDLENKSVTVNPGFDSLHSGSMSSFSTNQDDVSFRNSMSSDYGSFYSDTLSPAQDLKQEVNYEYIGPRLPITDEQEESSSKTGTSNSTSPTPSRSSTASQASTMTSGSSKNGHRPPKPPPPPRAHSLLPGNKVMQSLDGTFKFPISGDTSSSDEVTVTPTKPQAPRRQCKSAIIRSEYTNLDEQKTVYTSPLLNEEKETLNQEANNQENAKSSSNIQINHTVNQTSHKQQDDSLIINKNISDIPAVSLEVKSPKEEALTNSSSMEGVYDNFVAEKETKFQASVTIKTNVSSQKEKQAKSTLSRNKHPPLTKAPARPPPIYSKPYSGNFSKNQHPWKTLEDSYIALTSSNRELLIKLVNQALKKRKNITSKLDKIQFQWSDFEIDANQPSSVFAFGEKIAYHATMLNYSEYAFTLVISIQQQNQLQENSEVKYPVFGKFIDCIPSELVDSSSEIELESTPATVLVLDRSSILTIESFSESLPESLTEENEKELCYIILQLIQSLKSLQVQGIESIDSTFQDLLLVKTKNDKHHTLIFLYDSYNESDYSSDSNKISLCQYTFMLLFQMLKLQVVEDIASAKFSSNMSRKVFETAFSLLSEEKAVSLSQTKTLFECYLWGVTKVLESLQDSEDCDSNLHRWLDIERSNFIKNLVNDEDFSDLNVQNEYYSQFLMRTNARNIKEIASYL